MLARLLSRRWLLTTILVLAAAAVMARLGVWQLDRLAQRRVFNERVIAQQEAAPLLLDTASLNSDLYSMEYRSVVVTGRWLPEDEIVLRNQVWLDEYGSHLGVKLYTPLLIDGTDVAILVERGWIPAENAELPERAVYAYGDVVTVTGQLRRAETDFGLSTALRPDPTLSPGEERLETWNNLDLERLAKQSGTELLPMYLQRVPESRESEPPFAQPPRLDLSEGSHLGYAVQWFTFALILLSGYPLFARRQDEKKHT
jgi:surfeit locus 1 family protein